MDNAKTLKELIDLATSLYEEYGDAPLENEVWLGEIPADCHKGFFHKGFTSVIEVSTQKNTTYRKW